MKKTSLLTICMLFTTAIIWGFAFVAQVQGANHVGAFTLNFARFLLAVVSLLPVVLLFEKGRREKAERIRTVRASILAGIILYTASSLQQMGIAMTGSAGVAGFITGLYIVFVPIAGLLLFRHKTGLQVWVGAIFAFVGLFLLCFKPGEGFTFGIGELLLLIGSFFWTAHILVIDRMGRDIRPLHFAWGQFVVCAILGLITAFLFETPTWEGIFAAKWAILYCGVLSVGVAYTLQILGQRRADPTFATIILSTESVFSAVGGALFGVDKISWVGYVGCLLMFAGILVSQLPTKKGKNEAENQYSS